MSSLMENKIIFAGIFLEGLIINHISYHTNSLLFCYSPFHILHLKISEENFTPQLSHLMDFRFITLVSPTYHWPQHSKKEKINVCFSQAPELSMFMLLWGEKEKEEKQSRHFCFRSSSGHSRTKRDLLQALEILEKSWKLRPWR